MIFSKAILSGALFALITLNGYADEPIPLIDTNWEGTEGVKFNAFPSPGMSSEQLLPRSIDVAPEKPQHWRIVGNFAPDERELRFVSKPHSPFSKEGLTVEFYGAPANNGPRLVAGGLPSGTLSEGQTLIFEFDTMTEGDSSNVMLHMINSMGVRLLSLGFGGSSSDTRGKVYVTQVDGRMQPLAHFMPATWYRVRLEISPVGAAPKKGRLVLRAEGEEAQAAADVEFDMIHNPEWESKWGIELNAGSLGIGGGPNHWYVGPFKLWLK